MIDFTRAELTHLAIHYVGNKSLGEALVTSESLIALNDDFVRSQLLRYLLGPFKTDIYYQFRKSSDRSAVRRACDQLFNGRSDFLESSASLANHLFDQSIHARIK